jgi:hypothetical protein
VFGDRREQPFRDEIVRAVERSVLTGEATERHAVVQRRHGDVRGRRLEQLREIGGQRVPRRARSQQRGVAFLWRE